MASLIQLFCVAEWAVELGKMMYHPNQSQANPDLSIPYFHYLEGDPRLVFKNSKIHNSSNPDIKKNPLLL